MNNLISLFIDNELSLDEKMAFVLRVSDDLTFKSESINLLEQERHIRSAVVRRLPTIKLSVRKRMLFSKIRPLAAITAAVAAAVVILFFLPASQEVFLAPHRFVIYRPDVTKAEITGTFTDWNKISMNRIGTSGYWDITVHVPLGEHRFTYILDGKQSFADPTIPAREQDDFGGVNSIISVESTI